ncbi:hypothetical protein EON65_07560 [archaeon]|nr:MAG: hypothetical protein EON65_07560 [archaeon]
MIPALSLLLVCSLVLWLSGGLISSQNAENVSGAPCDDCIKSQFGHSKRIFYIKTHKTGSSTVTGLLWRELCLRLQFNCFVPPASQAGKIWNLANTQDRMKIKRSKGSRGEGPLYDAWIHHVRYHMRIPTDLVQAPYLLVSSVRRPAHRFVSAWYWYNLEKTTRMPLSSFIYASNQSEGAMTGIQWRYRTGLDATSEELLGMELVTSDKATYAKRLNDYLLPLIRFDKLVLIVCDRFDESLLILRHLLRFHSVAETRNHSESNTLADIWTYLPQKVRSSNGSVQLTEELLQVLDTIQPYDMLLYLEANRALDRHIQEYGTEKFNVHLQQYRDRLRRVQLECQNTYQSTARGDLDCHQLQVDNREAIGLYWNKDNLPG